MPSPVARAITPAPTTPEAIHVARPLYNAALLHAREIRNRYTVLDISRLLRDKSLTFVQISDMFGFSSPAYFSRYVSHNLGVRPTDYRG